MVAAFASVYVIGAVAGHQKIGASWLPESRLAFLQRTRAVRLHVNFAREYERAIAFRIESIIKRSLAPIHLGGEWYALEPPAAALAVAIAERVCYDVELPRIKAGEEIEARRLAIGLTKREIAKRLEIPELRFHADYSAALRGKSPPRIPDIFDRVRAVLTHVYALPTSAPPEVTP